MDILSDVNVVGSLTTSGNLDVRGNTKLKYLTLCTGGSLYGITWLNASNSVLVAQNNAKISVQNNGKLSILDKGYFTICAGANVEGLMIKIESTIPANCTKFQIGDYCFRKPTSVQAFMKDSSSNWNSVELDFQFERCSTDNISEFYGLISNISSAFVEEKQMYFIIGR